MNVDALYRSVTGAEAEELAENPREPRRGFIHMASLTLTKIADGLIDPKIVLAWLLNALGAPAAAVGALTPVREAGALLPQLWLVRQLSQWRTRAAFWAVGAALQGAAALAIAAAAVTLDGPAAGWTIVALLAGFAVARAMCSISHKDALARTVEKTRRGAVTGVPASVAPVVVLAFAAALAIGLLPRDPGVIAVAVAVAGGLWLMASALFLRLGEPGDAPAPEATPERLIAAVRENRQLRNLIAIRALLAVTALGPPFLVLSSAAADGEAGLGALGPLMLASAAASILSGYLWGRVSDHSSRQTLILAGALGGVVYAGAAALDFSAGGLGGVFGSAALMFSAQVAYEGVRAGRKLHLTDMTTDQNRARFTAVANSFVGVALLFGGVFGLIADIFGVAVVLGIFSGLCFVSILISRNLAEVQKKGGVIATPPPFLSFFAFDPVIQLGFSVLLLLFPNLKQLESAEGDEASEGHQGEDKN